VKRKAKDTLGGAYGEADMDKRKNLQEVTRLAKDRKLFQIWLKQSNA